MFRKLSRKKKPDDRRLSDAGPGAAVPYHEPEQRPASAALSSASARTAADVCCQRLWDAARTGDVASVRQCLKTEKLDVNAMDKVHVET